VNIINHPFRCNPGRSGETGGTSAGSDPKRRPSQGLFRMEQAMMTRGRKKRSGRFCSHIFRL